MSGYATVEERNRQRDLWSRQYLTDFDCETSFGDSKLKMVVRQFRCSKCVQ